MTSFGHRGLFSGSVTASLDSPSVSLVLDTALGRDGREELPAACDGVVPPSVALTLIRLQRC